MVFHWSLSHRKSPQVSRTLLSILVYHNNPVVGMISTILYFQVSSCPCNNPLVSVLTILITFGITVTFMFHRFFSSLVRSKYSSLFVFFQFYRLVSQNSKVYYSAVSLFSWRSLAWVVFPRWGDSFVSQNRFLGQILGCAYTMYIYALT